MEEKIFNGVNENDSSHPKEMKSLGWKFLHKETFGNGKIFISFLRLTNEW